MNLILYIIDKVQNLKPSEYRLYSYLIENYGDEDPNINFKVLLAKDNKLKNIFHIQMEDLNKLSEKHKNNVFAQNSKVLNKTKSFKEVYDNIYEYNFTLENVLRIVN